MQFNSYDMYLSEDSINSLSFEKKKTFLAIILWFGLYRASFICAVTSQHRCPIRPVRNCGWPWARLHLSSCQFLMWWCAWTAPPTSASLSDDTIAMRVARSDPKFALTRTWLASSCKLVWGYWGHNLTILYCCFGDFVDVLRCHWCVRTGGVPVLFQKQISSEVPQRQTG